MRLLKAQNTNLRNIYGKGVKYDVDDQVIVDSTRAMIVPVGTLAQRPGEDGVTTSSTVGQVRYNTTTDEFEFYSDNEWRKVRYKEPTSIYQQPLGVGDDDEKVFGPLDTQDPDYPIPASAENMLVFVENVFQISGTNYTMVQNPTITDGPNAPYAPGYYIVFQEPVPLDKPVTVLHNFDK